MKISLNWIKEFVDITGKYSAKELAELLTLRTCEVEGYEEEGRAYSNMVVGEVKKIRPHPQADKLLLADTDIDGAVVQIVCGGKNLAEGMYVAVALPGARVKWHGEGDLVELQETKIRGEKSTGMICAGEEIGLPPCANEGITDLTELWKSWGIKPSKPGTSLAQGLGLTDTIFDVDNKSLTHRPDLWGHYGMAREIAAITGSKLKNFVVKNPVVTKGSCVKVTIENPPSASRFLSVIITGIKIAESPEWLRKRVIAVGMRPVNNIVDVTNYVMHELGHPLHAFDRRVVKNDTFVIRNARDGEMTETLDHKKRKLSSEDALVTNGKDILGIAGVMGGLNSEIKNDTTEIILEAACWDPISIRKTSSRHGIRSDAAQRFEKSLDPEITGIAFHRGVELILKLLPDARIAGASTDVYPKPATTPIILLDTARASKKIGVNISETEMAKHLKALQFGVMKGPKKGILQVTIPTFRATKDVSIEDDLVEEVARMHGYEKIPPQLPLLPMKLPRQNMERTLKHKARQILSLGLGFSETNHYSFYGVTEIEKCLLPKELHVELENPLTEDQTHMRISLLPHMLKSIAVNQKARSHIKLYEIGRTYLKGPELFPREEKYISGVIFDSSKSQAASGGTATSKAIFGQALGALQTFLEQFDAKKIRIEPCSSPPPYGHPSKCAEIKIEGKSMAVLYEIHPQVLKNFDLKGAACGFEINFTKLVASGLRPRTYKQLPRFPGIEIDISVLVPKRTPVRTITELVRRCEQNLISEVSIIDIFEDKSLGEDKKSVTVRVRFQSPDRTLTEEETRGAQSTIFETLKKTGYAIRGA